MSRRGISDGSEFEFAFSALHLLVLVLLVAGIALFLINYRKKEKRIREAYEEYTANGVFACKKRYMASFLLNGFFAFFAIVVPIVIFIAVIDAPEGGALDASWIWIALGVLGLFYSLFMIAAIPRGFRTPSDFVLRNGQLIARNKEGVEKAYDIASCKLFYSGWMDENSSGVEIHMRCLTINGENYLIEHYDMDALEVFRILFTYIKNDKLSELKDIKGYDIRGALWETEWHEE